MSPARSKSQARLMAAAKHGADFPMAKKVRASMTDTQLSHFSHRTEKNLPAHVEGNRYAKRLRRA